MSSRELPAHPTSNISGIRLASCIGRVLKPIHPQSHALRPLALHRPNRDLRMHCTLSHANMDSTPGRRLNCTSTPPRQIQLRLDRGDQSQRCIARALCSDPTPLSQIAHQRTAGRLCLWGAGSSSCCLQKQPRDDRCSPRCGREHQRALELVGRQLWSPRFCRFWTWQIISSLAAPSWISMRQHGWA